MVEIVKVLRILAELEWWSFAPAPDGNCEDLCSPPFIVWRHKHKTLALAEFFAEAVQSFSGCVRWEFIVSDRNFLLQPARIREYAKANNLLGDWPAAKELSKIDPDFGKRANAELKLLAEHIAKAAATVVLA